MLHDTIATEALIQRGRTQLYVDLVSLYQETQDALRELKNASPAKYNIQLKLIDYPKKLKSLIKRHMGLTISKVDIVESRSVNAYATFDLSKSFMDDLSSNRKVFTNKIDLINSVYDDRNATTVIAVKSKPDFGFKFGIYTGFWRMRNVDNSYHFTADELAAVTLHEIGHFDHWIKTMSKPILRLLDASDLITYVKDKSDRSTILVLLDKLKDSKTLDKSWQPVLKVTDQYFRSNKEYTNPEYMQAITSLETLMLAEISTRTVSEFNVLTLWGWNEHINTPSTQLHDIDAERSADEFAARSGSYSALASAIKKMTDFGDVNSLMYVKQFMWTFPGVLISSLYKFSAIFQIHAEDIAFGYDPIIRRLELMAQTAKHAFSNSELPQHVKDDMVIQIKEVEQYIREREKSPYRLLRKHIKEWKDQISKYGRIVISPFHSRLAGDYHRLQDANRNLGRHSLYYLAEPK